MNLTIQSEHRVSCGVLATFVGTAIMLVATHLRVGEPVPITAQTLALLLISSTFGWRVTFASMIGFLTGMVLLWAGSSDALTGNQLANAGFLLGMLAAAPFMGVIFDVMSKHGGKSTFLQRFIIAFLTSVIGLTIVFDVGYFWLAFHHQIKGFLQQELSVFVVVEGLQILLASTLFAGFFNARQRIRRLLP